MTGASITMESREMREQFEKWVIKKAMKHGYKYVELALKRDGDGYSMTWVDSAWMGWKAALEMSKNDTN